VINTKGGAVIPSSGAHLHTRGRGPHPVFVEGSPSGSLVVVRHGATEWSRLGRHTGRTDVPLVDEGRRQAEGLAEVLAGRRFALVLTSPLIRARATCEGAGFAGAATVDEDLAEWDYGDYEGWTTEAIRRERPGWTLFEDGVPGGETPSSVGRRADRVIARARAAPGDTLCFGHGHALRVLAARWVGLPPIGGRVVVLEPGSYGELGWERETPVIRGWGCRPPAPPG